MLLGKSENSSGIVYRFVGKSAYRSMVSPNEKLTSLFLSKVNKKLWLCGINKNSNFTCLLGNVGMIEDENA